MRQTIELLAASGIGVILRDVVGRVFGRRRETVDVAAQAMQVASEALTEVAKLRGELAALRAEYDEYRRHHP